MKIEVNKVYKAQYNTYDIYDIGVYVFRILSGPHIGSPETSPYYIAEYVDINIRIHLYPNHWGCLQKLSSLEEELL